MLKAQQQIMRKEVFMWINLQRQIRMAWKYNILYQLRDVSIWKTANYTPVCRHAIFLMLTSRNLYRFYWQWPHIETCIMLTEVAMQNGYVHIGLFTCQRKLLNCRGTHTWFFFNFWFLFHYIHDFDHDSIVMSRVVIYHKHVLHGYTRICRHYLQETSLYSI